MMNMLNLEDINTWSRVPGKMDVYRLDAGFLYAAATLQNADRIKAERGLQRITYALLKPDAFAFGKAVLALEYLLSQGFSVMSYHAFRLTEAQMLGLWRYQWNRATPARMAASLSIGSLGPSILVVLRDEQATNDGLPAAPRLWSLKGSASSEGRSPQRLRSVLNVNGRYFGYVHVPDEPADVVRELALLLGTPAMFNTITGDLSGDDCETSLRSRISDMRVQFELSWAPDEIQSTLSDSGSNTASYSIMNGYSEIHTNDVAVGTPEARNEAWRRVATCAPLLRDNLPGVRAIVESGDVTDPAALWRMHAPVIDDAD